MVNIDSNIPFAYRRDIPFNLDFAANGDLQTIEDEAAINQSIYAILSSDNGDKPMEYQFGSGLGDLVFENANPQQFLEYEIKDRIRTKLERFESSITLLEITVDFSNINNHEINVFIPYLLPDGITVGNFSENLSLEGLGF